MSEFDLNLNPAPEPRCVHCKRRRGDRRAVTLACPYGRGSFPQFRSNQFYAPKPTKEPK